MTNGGQFTYPSQLITLNYPVILFHRRSITVSSEIYPLYSKISWASGDSPIAWKAFKQHCQFTFGGCLKRKVKRRSVTTLCYVLEIKVVKYTVRGNLEPRKRRKSTLITQRICEAQIEQCLLGTSFTRKFSKRVSHLSNFSLI